MVSDRTIPLQILGNTNSDAADVAAAPRETLNGDRAGSLQPCDAAAEAEAVQSDGSGGLNVYLETFGCQMNELDSELVRGHLSALGYRFTSDASQADVILYNTCSVREQAENKVLSRVGLIGIEKQQGREVILGLLGCLSEREGEPLLKRYPQIDLLCGPGELDKLPMLLENVCKTGHIARADRMALQGSSTRRSATLAAAEDDLELLDLSRAFDPGRNRGADGQVAAGRSAYVRITRGCNKFCTYCVVPNTRGPEVHRPPDAIIDECKRLADAGVIEVTLLGQTVNHYLYVHGAAVGADGCEKPQVGPGLSAFRYPGSPDRDNPRFSTPPRSNRSSQAQLAEAPPVALRGSESRGSGIARRRTTTFADLLHRIHEEVPVIQRLRFVTSYPRDFTDDALAVMAASPRICRYLHVPAQSGSDRILKAMNRGYTIGEYLEFIDRARSFMPDISLAGDIIVGFPGETDEDFQQTCDLLKQVPFKNNFIFKYSPRPGTAAIRRLPDDVPDAVKRRRNNELLALQHTISEQVHRTYIGQTVDVFVDQVSRKGSDGAVQVSGRTGGDLITVLDLPSTVNAWDYIGSIVSVEILDSRALLLSGRLAGSDGLEAVSQTATAVPAG